MKVIYTHRALSDIDAILEFIQANFPTAREGFESRVRLIARRIGEWPRSAEEVSGRSGIYVVPMVHYPYKIFYRIGAEAVEILYVHHAARRLP